MKGRQEGSVLGFKYSCLQGFNVWVSGFLDGIWGSHLHISHSAPNTVDAPREDCFI